MGTGQKVSSVKAEEEEEEEQTDVKCEDCMELCFYKGSHLVTKRGV
jgi:hypothetical protein